MASKKTKKSGKNSLKKITPRLYELMVEENLSELVWEEKGNFKLEIKRKSAYHSTGTVIDKVAPPKEKIKKEKSNFIHSPMSGIFYDSPQPEADTFVKKGDEVKEDSTVCIIEAMKLMNEVKVEKPCRIDEKMVKNAESVQINQPLFKITDI